MEIINNVLMQEFLIDFEQNLEISFDLEESKKTELIEIAKNKGILVEGSRDLGIFSGVYEILDTPNGNRKIVPLNQEILRKLPQLVGKSINLNHIRRYVVGFICDFRFIEKEKKIIIYGIFFKSCFAEEWDKLVKLFKDKKVGLSSEIWSPKSKRVYSADGTYELKDIEFSGVAIIFINSKDKPAESDCLVLETSKKNYDLNQELVYSSLNKDNFKSYICENCKTGGLCGMDCENLVLSNQEMVAPTQQPSKIKIICSQCSHNFEYLFIPNQTSSIKCPNCLSILDQLGKMLYPPQIRNFELSCPNDSSRNWLILSNDDDKAKVRCQSCAKEYDLTFKEMPEDLKIMLSKIQFLHTGQKACWACGTYNDFIALSNQDKINLKCGKCGLDYFFNVSNQIKKDIKTIEEVGIKKDKEEQEMVELEKAKLEIEGLNKSLKDKDLENTTLKEGMVKSKSETKKLLRKAVGKIKLAKSALPKQVSDRVKELIKEGKAPKDAVKQAWAEYNKPQTSKLEKFIGGIKKLSNKIREAKANAKSKDLEISSLQVKLEETKSKVEPVIPVKVEEPVLETASLKVGDEKVDDLDGSNKRIKKIREQSQAYLTPAN